MFDYQPEYADFLLDKVEDIPIDTARERTKKSILHSIYRDIAEEYNYHCTEKEAQNKLNDLKKSYPLIGDDIAKILYAIPKYCNRYVLDVICDICKEVEDDLYDRALFDISSECETCEDDVIHIPSTYKNSCRYSSICEDDEVFELKKYGLCCANCISYHNGYCCNRVYPSDICQPPVKPYQICECYRLARKYGNYYFSENGFYNSYKVKENKKLHFSEVAEEVIEKTKEKLREKEDFIEFIKSEIPEVHDELVKQYKKRKRMEEN